MKVPGLVLTALLLPVLQGGVEHGVPVVISKIFKDHAGESRRVTVSMAAVWKAVHCLK